MRRHDEGHIEEALHALAEHDERLETNELIARIEWRLAGDGDTSVVVMDERPDMNSNRSTPLTPKRRWAPAAIAFGAALLVIVAIALPIWLLGDGEPTVASPTTLASSPTSAATPSTLPVERAATSWTLPQVPPGEVPPTVPPGEVGPFPPWLLSVPLSEAVPGFTDIILMTGSSRSHPSSFSDFSVVRWQPSEPITELLAAPESSYLNNENVGWSVGMDISTGWRALVRGDAALIVQGVPTVPGESTDHLVVGHGVERSAVWHDTEAGQLAWLECPNVHEGPATLFTLDTTDPSANQVPVASFEQGCHGNPGDGDPNGHMLALETWADSGMWLGVFNRSYNRIDSILIAADGTKTSYGSGGPIGGPSPDGATIWNEFGKSYLLSPDGHHRSPIPGVTDNRFASQAWWSPDGTRLALELASYGSSRGEFRIVDVASGNLLMQRVPDPRWMHEATVAWSADSRFVLFLPAYGSPLVFHDTATDTTTRVPLADHVWDIRIP